ncbi:MAG: inorganic phosphate transporter [Proteobacteria bacterium]|nr:inorganic phosphate transporter [Pseudomonadota bacterium]
MGQNSGAGKNASFFSRLIKGEQTSGTIKLGLAAVFLGLIGAVSSLLTEGQAGAMFIIAASVIGGYMALNIGANDVANNVGPAVGSKVLTMAGALIIAAIFEAAGALIAGGEVVNTISKGIIDPSSIPSADQFVLAMMAALLAAALWINLATWFGAPVSTTHSIVGGVLGAGIAAAGVATVNWPTMGAIAASWVISPLMGGIIAALFLWFIKGAILYRKDRISAAITWVPLLLGVMGSAFTIYLSVKGFKRIWEPELWMVLAIGVASLGVIYAAAKPVIARAAGKLENSKKAVNKLFVIPLIFGAALLSFAHGANDVANAVGPLAAIVSVVSGGGVEAKVVIPLWVMAIGAVGLSVGLLLFGPKLIKTVGQEITRLNPTRAFCVALAAAITVIAASWLGLPVSSTHTAVGGVFGVGFLREYFANRRMHIIGPLFMWAETQPDPRGRKIRKKRQKKGKRKLVRRAYLMTIIAAWVITVPVSAFVSAMIYLILLNFI